MDQILAKANFGARCSGLGCKEQSTHMCMEHGSFCMNCFEEQCNKCENVKIKEGYQNKNPSVDESIKKAEVILCKIAEIINKSYFNNLYNELHKCIAIIKSNNQVSKSQFNHLIFTERLKELKEEVDKFSQSRQYCDFIFNTREAGTKSKLISIEDHIAELNCIKQFYQKEYQDLIDKYQEKIHKRVNPQTEDCLTVKQTTELIDAFRNSINRQANEFLNEQNKDNEGDAKRKIIISFREQKKNRDLKSSLYCKQNNFINDEKVPKQLNIKINDYSSGCAKKRKQSKLKKHKIKKQNTNHIINFENDELINRAVENHNKRRNTILSDEAN